jgi:hypothetical protein
MSVVSLSASLPPTRRPCLPRTLKIERLKDGERGPWCLLPYLRIGAIFHITLKMERNLYDTYLSIKLLRIFPYILNYE